MFGAISKATYSSFQKVMNFCRNIYMKKDMKLLAFIFEQPSYIRLPLLHTHDVMSSRDLYKFGICIYKCRSTGIIVAIVVQTYMFYGTVEQ